MRMRKEKGGENEREDNKWEQKVVAKCKMVKGYVKFVNPIYEKVISLNHRVGMKNFM